MSRVVRSTAAGIAVEERDEPPGTAGGVVLETAAASICGTDVALATWGDLPFVLGHELSGHVDGVAYAVEPTLFCGECEQCRLGETQRCTGEASLMGFFSDGGMGDAVLVPRSALVPLPEGLAVADACLVEPVAVALHASRKGRVTEGMQVGVVGGGSIGLAVTACLVAAGHTPVVEARHHHQQAAAERLGARVGEVANADVVIEATGTESGVVRAVDGLRPAGRMVLVGVFHGPVPLPGLTTLVKEIEVVGSTTYGRCEGHRETEEAAALLAARPEVAATLITHRFPLDEAARAFSVAADRPAGAIKVVVEP